MNQGHTNTVSPSVTTNTDAVNTQYSTTAGFDIVDELGSTAEEHLANSNMKGSTDTTTTTVLLNHSVSTANGNIAKHNTNSPEIFSTEEIQMTQYEKQSSAVGPSALISTGKHKDKTTSAENATLSFLSTIFTSNSSSGTTP